MSHIFRGSPAPAHASQDTETASDLATQSIETRSAAIVAAISSLAQQTISTSNQSSPHSANLSNAAPLIFQRDEVLKSFDDAIKAIRAETYRACSQVSEALRMSQALNSKGPVDRALDSPGIGSGGQTINTLRLVEIEGNSFYQLAKTNLNIPPIIICQAEGSTATSTTSPASVLLPTTKNVKILQHAYGRALRYKVDLIKDYITSLGIEDATSAPKRNKPAYENDSLMTLPQKHRLGTFLDMNTVHLGSMGQAKVEDSELVLAFLLPTGDHQHVEVISGNVKDKAGIGETDLVIPVSDDTIKLLYELYCGLKECIARRKAAAGAQGPAQAQPAHDPTDVALFRRMRYSGLDEDDKDPGSKRIRTSD